MYTFEHPEIVTFNPGRINRLPGIFAQRERDNLAQFGPIALSPLAWPFMVQTPHGDGEQQDAFLQRTRTIWRYFPLAAGCSEIERQGGTITLFFIAAKFLGLLRIKQCGHLARAPEFDRYQILMCKAGRRRPENSGGRVKSAFPVPASDGRVPNKAE